MTDGEIVELFFRRDERALFAVKRDYEAYLMKIAMAVLGESRDAEEVVNDAYARAWNAIPPARPNTLSTYLGRIVRNLAIDRLRTRGAEKRSGECVPILAELEECLPGGETPAEKLENSELAGALNAFLAGLSKNKRIVFMRRYWYSESVNNIAASIGKSPAAVGMQLKRTRDELKRFLTERSIEL